MIKAERGFEIKRGDIVKMVIPKGKKFEIGGSEATGFCGGIVPQMVSFAEGKEHFIVKKVDEDYIELVGSIYDWDKTWFEKVVNENKEEKEEVKCKFKVGDKVRLVVPKGKVFKAGVDQRDFKGCITKAMVDIVSKYKVFEIEEIIEGFDLARFKGEKYVWDLTWFEKVEEVSKKVSKREMKQGDKIRLVVPEGEKFEVDTEGFKYGLVDEMIDIVNDNNGILTVSKVFSDMVFVKEDQCFFNWDKRWFEVVENKVVTDEIKLEFKGKSTKASFNGKTGRAVRSVEDKEDRKVGVLIATMRAVGFDEDMVNKVVDVLFDDVKGLKDYTLEELLKEVANRLA